MLTDNYCNVLARDLYPPPIKGPYESTVAAIHIDRLLSLFSFGTFSVSLNKALRHIIVEESYLINLKMMLRKDELMGHMYWMSLSAERKQMVYDLQKKSI